MTAEGPPAPPLRTDRATSNGHRVELESGALPNLCPYLATPEGTWRSARPVREHRCTAVNPPVPLAAEKQRRLCLVEAHVDCATYGAAMAARTVPPVRHVGPTRPVARMTPVILDQGRFDIRVPALRNDRTSQGVLVGLLGVAFVAVLIARPADPAGAGPLAGDGSPAPSGSAVPTDPAVAETSAPSPTSTGEPVASGEPTAEPTDPDASPDAQASAAPTATAEPTLSGATYRVKSGDTLTAIAARFGTTPQVLAQLNDIADPSRLRIGQVLILP
jgi:LysM repeat protein